MCFFIYNERDELFASGVRPADTEAEKYSHRVNVLLKYLLQLLGA